MVECLPLDPVAQVRFPPRAVGIFLHPVTFGGQCGGSTARVPGFKMEMFQNYSVVPSRFRDESIKSREICSRYMYITHFYCLAVEAGFYSDVVECLPLDPAAQIRFLPRAVGIFLHPVTYIQANRPSIGHHAKILQSVVWSLGKRQELSYPNIG